MDVFISTLYRIFVLALLACLYRMLSRKVSIDRPSLILVTVCMMAVLLTPLLQSVQNITFPSFETETAPDLSQNEAWQTALFEQTQKELTASFCGELSKKFGLRADTFFLSVQLKQEENTFSLVGIEVKLRPQDSYLATDVKKFLETQSGTKVAVSAEGGKGE